MLEYYVVPIDTIYFSNPTVDEDIIVSGDLLEETEIYSGRLSNNDFKISLCPIVEDIANKISERLHTNLTVFQVGFKIEIFGDIKAAVYLEDSDLRQNLILSFLLAHKEHKLLSYQWGDESLVEVDSSGPGLSIPYSFVKYEPKYEGINVFYGGELSKTFQSGQFVCSVSDDQIAELKVICHKVYSHPLTTIKAPIIEMFLHVHFTSWIKEGLFYPALITFFTCFECILDKQGE